MLVGSVLLGLAAVVLGAGSDDDYQSGRSLVGLVAGLVAMVAAGIVFALLSARGCGD